MSHKRRLLAALLAVSCGGNAHAGCFDWLFHRQQTPVMPYAAGFAPPPNSVTIPTAVAAPVGVAGGPAISSHFGAPMTAFPGHAGVAGHAGAAGTGDFAAMQAPTLPPGVTAMRPPTAVQMPAYGAVAQPLNNPSVYTGMPVDPRAPQLPMTAFRPPVAVAGTPQMHAHPQTAYNAAAAYQPPATGWGQPTFGQPQAAPAAGQGFLGKVLGNSYGTTYNNVPTTVYRPVQQIDPATGQVVIVQQPCTTSLQQVQRTPYTSLQHAPQAAPAPAPHYGEPVCGHEGAPFGGSTFGQGTIAPQSGTMPLGGAVGSGVSQAGGAAPHYGPSQPIAPQSFQAPPSSAPTTAPLQGLPPGYTSPPTPGTAVPAEDRSTVVQPQLGAAQTPSSPWVQSQRSFIRTPTTPPAAAEAERSEPHANANRFGTFDRSVSDPQPARFSDLPPIPAAEDYRAPQWNSPDGGNRLPDSEAGPSTTPRISPPSVHDRTASAPEGRRPTSRFVASPQSPTGGEGWRALD